MHSSSSSTTAKKPSFFIELMFNIVVPSVILMKFSDEAQLGAVLGLIVALLFPISFGLWDLNRRKTVNFFSVLGLVSVLLTGGIGLLQLDPQYIAIKEAAIPACIGVGVWLSQFTKYPVVEKLLLNPDLVNVEKLQKRLAERKQTAAFAQVIKRAGIGVSGGFFLSATLNYILARMIVVSPAGSEAFNQELGRMTALSFPVIVLPVMLILMGSVFYLFWQISRLTGESIEHFLHEK